MHRANQQTVQLLSLAVIFSITLITTVRTAVIIAVALITAVCTTVIFSIALVTTDISWWTDALALRRWTPYVFPFAVIFSITLITAVRTAMVIAIALITAVRTAVVFAVTFVTTILCSGCGQK